MRLRRKKTDPDISRRQVQEARKAVRQVSQRDATIHDSSSEIMSVVRDLRDFQRRNNFARAIRHALGGGSG